MQEGKHYLGCGHRTLFIWMGTSVVLSERWKDPGVLIRAGRTEGRQVDAVFSREGEAGAEEGRLGEC